MTDTQSTAPIQGVSDTGPIDPRLVFLLRAAARFDLVEAGELSLDQAFGGLLPALELLDVEKFQADTGRAA
jgi:hypothetical protein